MDEARREQRVLNFEDRQKASEAGKLGVEARRRRRELTPAERALEAIADQTGRLARELLDAALGKGDFSELGPQHRLAAVVKALEYGIGRPGSQAKPEPPEQEQLTGNSLFTTSSQEPQTLAIQEPGPATVHVRTSSGHSTSVGSEVRFGRFQPPRASEEPEEEEEGVDGASVEDESEELPRPRRPEVPEGDFHGEG